MYYLIEQATYNLELNYCCISDDNDNDVGSYLKLGGQVVMWGAQSASSDTGLIDLTKPGWAIAQPAQRSPKYVYTIYTYSIFIVFKSALFGTYQRKVRPLDTCT